MALKKIFVVVATDGTKSDGNKFIDHPAALVVQGGHYEPHYDSAKKGSDWRGARLATFMIYLSDVTAGGSTVFPLIRYVTQQQP